MTDFALDSLFAPIDGDATPAGPDLEYDPDFLELGRTAAPKSERVMGDDVKAAEEPDWTSVGEMAQALLQRSKDLRLAVPLSAAWIHRAGLPGWAAGMTLIRGLLETYWDHVHPQLDAADNNDPTERVNAVAPIADRQGLLAYLLTAPFVESPRLGRFTLRDLRVASGEIKPAASDTKSDSAPPSMAEIEACCMDCSEEDLLAAVEAVNRSLDDVHAIDQIFNEHVGTAGPELKPLLTDLQDLKKFLAPQLARRLPQAAAEMATGDGEIAEGGAAAPVDDGRINNPQDVVRRLDDICEYYARTEPSSPIPLLLRRARRLVGLSFEDLMKDLAPSGINELQVVAGPSTDE